MSFLKPPRPPRAPSLPEPVKVDEDAVQAELDRRERSRKGFAATLLTGERGLGSAPFRPAGTKQLLGDGP